MFGIASSKFSHVGKVELLKCLKKGNDVIKFSFGKIYSKQNEHWTESIAWLGS